MSQFDLSFLGVAADMAGCPNCCRHCWLGSHKNGNISKEDFKEIAEAFRNWRNENGRKIERLNFCSWWREPDFRDDYRELWELEKELSSPGSAQRFELLSTWRLARDPSYADWAAHIGTKVCQITFFGMDETTDWGMRRKGAFLDQITATERCLTAGIAPRWQLFLTKRCLHELPDFLYLMKHLKLRERCEQIGGQFEFFIGGISPEGNGFGIENERIEKGDLALIPQEMIALSRDGLDGLGEPENELLPELLSCSTPPERYPTPWLFIDADFDVYPNIAEPTTWWKLGNLKTDGVERIMKTYMDGATPGMTANNTFPVSVLAERFGNPNSTKLYTCDDLICRILHEWRVEQS